MNAKLKTRRSELPKTSPVSSTGSATEMDALPASDHPPAGLFRRLAACIYDCLLVIAILVIPASVVMAFRGGDAIPPGNLLFQVLLGLTTATFFIGFWMHGGQTLGMRAWRLRLERNTDAPITATIALIRFLGGLLSIAACGLGVLWIVVDPRKLTWADHLAGTHMVVIPKRK
jgi:uncharacterized RDD family membrane protein YckC